MFELIFFSILTLIIVTPCGSIFFKQNNNIVSLSNNLIYGIILISFITLVINFFFPLNALVNTLILILPLSIILKNLKTYLSSNFLKFLFFNSIIIFLLVAKSNVYRPDAILYHLPYTGILNNEKIIFGLSNLHFRFAHISIIQYFASFFNNFLFNIQGIVFSLAIISSAIIVNFLTQVFFYLKNKIFNFHFFFLFFILIFIAYKMNRYSEYGNDAPTHFLFFFLISELIQSFNKKDNPFNSNHLLLSVFIVLNKITMAFAIFLPFIFQKKKDLFKIFIIPKNYFALIFLTLWILKNIIVSGCMIYPVNKLCFKSLEWTNISEVKAVSQENEAWTKSWPDYKNINQISQSEYSANFNWVNTWSKTHLKKIIKILVPYFFLLILISLIINFKYKKKEKPQFKDSKKNFLILIFLMIAFSIIWFLKVPVFRYGYSYFVSFLALSFAYICSFNKYIKNSVYKFLNFFLIFFIVIFVLKNMHRILKPESVFKSYIPQINFLNNTDVNKIKLGNFTYYESSKMCGYSFSPCTHYKNKKLKSKRYYGYKVIIND